MKKKYEYKAIVEMIEVRELFSRSVLLVSGSSMDVIEVADDVVVVGVFIPEESGGAKRQGFALLPPHVKKLHEMLGEYLEGKKLIEEYK